MRSLLPQRSTFFATLLCAGAGFVLLNSFPASPAGPQEAGANADINADVDANTGVETEDYEAVDYESADYEPRGKMYGTGGTVGRPGVTRPSKQRDLGFNVPGGGQIKDVFVKDGDLVEEGMLLITLHESVERRELAIMKLKAGVQADLEIDAAEKELAAKQVELDEVEELRADGDRSETEYRQAKVDVEIARVKVRAAKAAKQEAELRIELQEEQMELKRLFSPISGVVVNLEAGEGEPVDSSKPALTVVQNDPLWVEVSFPTDEAESLRAGQVLQVRYSDKEPWQPAEIILFAPVADAGSGLQPVRLEMANPEGRASGKQVRVRKSTAAEEGATAAAGENVGE